MNYVNVNDKVKLTSKGMNLLVESGGDFTPPKPTPIEDLLNWAGDPLTGKISDVATDGAVLVDFIPQPNGKGRMVAYVSIWLRMKEFSPEEGNFVIIK